MYVHVCMKNFRDINFLYFFIFNRSKGIPVLSTHAERVAQEQKEAVRRAGSNSDDALRR